MTKPKVLIIEDEEFLLELMEVKLTKSGFKTYSSTDAEGGLRIMRQFKPDVILLDLLLPGMSGFELMEQKMKDPAVTSIPIIIFSNLGDDKSIERGKELGAKSYFVKAHTTPEEVVGSIRRILNKK